MKLIVTGAFGFIGSNLVEALNRRGIVPYVIDKWKVDDPKWKNIRGLNFIRIDESEVGSLTLPGEKLVVVALGASVDTREGMSEALWENNVESVIRLSCHADKFIYASSGATYGLEENDFTERVVGLRAANPYAQTKLALDDYFYNKDRTYGLRFFNVFGPREFHKGDMASLVTKGLLKQPPLYADGKWHLFKHPSGLPISRDFVFVGDVVKAIIHFVDTNGIKSGVYNIGSGESRSFESLVKAVEDIPIEYVDLPDALKDQYQRVTKANLTKLREVAGYKEPFLTLEEGIEKTREWLKVNG